MSSVEPVSAQMMSTVAINSGVRSGMWAMLNRSVSIVRGLRCIENELVAGTVYGQEILRVRRVRLKLLPQAEDMVVHGPAGRIVLVAPDFVQQRVSRVHHSGRRRKEFQELEFLRGHRHRQARAASFHAGEID